MGYSHTFYAVELSQIQSVFGSNDDELIAEMLTKYDEELAGNDEAFVSDIEAGCPDSKTALREMIAGSYSLGKGIDGALYGYVFEFICEHYGEHFGDDVASVEYLPFRSLLSRSGAPIPLPKIECWPIIGYLPLESVSEELDRLENIPKEEPSSRFKDLISEWSFGLLKKSKKIPVVVCDVDYPAYRDTLKDALEKKKAIISFQY